MCPHTVLFPTYFNLLMGDNDDGIVVVHSIYMLQRSHQTGFCQMKFYFSATL